MRDLLRAQGMVGPLYEDLLQGMLLIVSELVTNAVLVAQCRVTVRLATVDGILRIEVYDDGRGEPTLERPPPEQPGGRGLWIVEELTDGWGVSPHADGGKTVWCEILLR